MWKQVLEHSLNWHMAKRTGCIDLKLDDGSVGAINHLSCLDMDALGNILRNEPHVWYHTTRGDLTSAKTPVDEEERE